MSDTQRERAQRLLHFMLPATTTALQVAAKAEGIGWETVRRAGDDIGVVRVRQRVGAWLWKLPQQSDPGSDDDRGEAQLRELLAAVRERENVARKRERVAREAPSGPETDKPDEPGAPTPLDSGDASGPAEPPREGTPVRPGILMRPGEYGAQCSRCQVLVITSLPFDVAPLCHRCAATPPPNVSTRLPWADDGSRAPVDFTDELDAWKAG